MSTSSATGIVVAEIHAELEQSPGHTTSRQPSATAAAVRLPPEGPSNVHGKLGISQQTLKSVPFRGMGSSPHPIHDPRGHTPNGISICSAAFAGLMTVSNRQTRRCLHSPSKSNTK